MLIVIALVVAIASISLNAFRGAREQAEFRQTVNDVVSLLQKARNMALNSEQVDGAVADGYGVTVSNGSLILFADPETIDGTYDDTDDLSIEEKVLTTTVTIDAPAIPFYTPPLADLTILDAADAEETEIIFTITSSSTGKTQTVTLNTIGRVPEIST